MHPLQQKVAYLRSRLRQLLLLYGLSATVAAMVVAAIALGTADYLFRPHDPGVRMLSSLALLAVFGWVAYRCLWLPISTHLGDAEIALRLKRRFPELGDQLACALEFLDQPDDDPTAGSLSLRQAVIEGTWNRARTLDFLAALDPRTTFRAAGLALAACLAAAVLAALDPGSARLAATRLANPVSPLAWPRQTHLEFRNVVDRIVRGGAFEIEVIDRGRGHLPDDVQIEYRLSLPDGASTVQREPMRRRGRTVAFARRESVTRPFAYRAVGGDDYSMSWIELAVAEPPALEDLVLRLSPPAYTGYPPHSAEKHLRVLAGTTLAVSGRVNKPLESLMLHLEDREPVTAALDREGLRFRIPAAGGSEPAIAASGTYWFELVDRDGLRSETPPWELRAVPDPPPSVTIEQPSASLFVTSEAVVPLRVSAKDNLAVRQIVLKYRSEGGESQWSRHSGDATSSNDHSAARAEKAEKGSGAFSRNGPEGASQKGLLTSFLRPPALPAPPAGELRLFEGPAKAPPPADRRPSPLDSPGDHRVAEIRWALEPLGLQPGTHLILTATADDYQPATGESPPVRLSVITMQELEDRIAARQNLILTELRRTLDLQRGSRGQVTELVLRLEQLGQLGRPDVDHLQAAELTQRRIEGSLTGARESVPGYVADLLTDLDNNRIDRPDLRRRMQSLLDELEGLAREHLPPISHELTTAIKSAQADGARLDETWPADPAVAQSLQAAGEHQDRVITTLEQVLEDLGRWDDYRRFYREVGRLLREQEDLGSRTAESGRRTMGRDPRDLPPAEAAQLRGLAAGQLELARQLDRMGAEMDQAARQLDATAPLAADTIAHAVDEIRRRSVSGLMRTVGGHLEQNRTGQAIEVQRHVRTALQDVLDILANRREHELERLVERLREMETELADIVRQQAETAAGFRAAAAKGSGPFSRNGPEGDSQKRDLTPLLPECQRRLESLRDRQSELAKDTVRAARRLHRLRAEEAAQSAGQAGDRMGTAAKAADAGRADAGAEEAGRAHELIELAHRQLEARRQLAQAELAAEQIARLDDVVKHLHDSEQKVIDETRQLDRLSDSPGGLTRAHLADLYDLTGLQLAIQNETEQLSGKLIEAEAVQLVLDGAAGHMAEAAARLRRQQTGQETQRFATLARDRLAMLIEAFQTDPADPSQDPAGGAAGTGPDGEPMGEPIAAAEVKLLKLLQEDLNRRTAELAESATGQQPISEAHRRQFDTLVEEQGRLADLTLGLVLEPHGEENGNPSDRELGQASIPEDAHPLRAIARQMRDVQARLAQQAADTETTSVQERIVAQLDELLQHARSQQMASAESARQAPPSPDRRPDPQRDDQAAAEGDPQQAPAREATDDPGTAESIDERPDPQRTLYAMERLWNQLPERQREQLLQLAPEQFLPKYESQIEQYFRRLSQDQE